MLIYQPAPVSEDPRIRLADWRVFALPDGDHHFVGYNIGNTGRVSSKIVSFAPETMTGVTRSGRVYELVGAPGYDSDGLYTWATWKRINGIEECTDVTEQYIQSTKD